MLLPYQRRALAEPFTDPVLLEQYRESAICGTW
jgi:hypothetical protein